MTENTPEIVSKATPEDIADNYKDELLVFLKSLLGTNDEGEVNRVGRKFADHESTDPRIRAFRQRVLGTGSFDVPALLQTADALDELKFAEDVAKRIPNTASIDYLGSLIRVLDPDQAASEHDTMVAGWALGNQPAAPESGAPEGGGDMTRWAVRKPGPKGWEQS